MRVRSTRPRLTAPDLARVLVELEIGEAQPAVALSALARAAQHRAYPRVQLVDVERLGDVVVCAELESLQLVGLSDRAPSA